MPYSVLLAEAGSWLVVEYAGVVESRDLVDSRVEVAARNADGAVNQFILDFTRASEFVLSSDSVSAIRRIDTERKETLTGGRCALVAPRELVELGTTFLAAVSPLDLDFRVFRDRTKAEAWLRGELSPEPPPLPRHR